MNTFKKALFIGSGVIILPLGLSAAFIFAVAVNVDPTPRIIGFVAGMLAALFGWWLLRRASNSVWDALSWLFVHLMP